MEHSVFGSALAFIAFGANLMGTGVLLLFNPRDRVLRWYSAFVFFMLSWLFLQGVALSAGLPVTGWWWFGFVVNMMPIAFLTVTLVQVVGVSDRVALLFNFVAAAFLIVVIRDPFAWRHQLIWSVIFWGAGAVLYVIHGRRWRKDDEAPGGRRTLDITLNLLVPVGVIGALLLRDQFITFGLPIITIITGFLLFLGIVNHRYYNIEVRAVRSGDIGVRAAEHERLALLGEVSASIAHEVRNPLTGIRSLAQRLRDEPLDDDKRSRYLGVILDEIGRLERIVTNLLDVARRPVAASATDVVALGSLFSDLELLVEARAKARDVRIAHDASSLRVTASREPLAQALLNLLLNAIAHAPAGTSVDLGASRSNGAVTVFVRDRGAGIPADQRQIIFEPFHTATGGTGLGLAVVRTLARDHAWAVDVADTPGGGAELRLTVPAAGAP